MRAGLALHRAVAAAFASEGATIVVESAAGRPWASATFAGMRHELRLRLAGSAAARAAKIVLVDLAEREFDLPGHILVDIAAADVANDGGDVLLTIEALTVVAD